MYRSGSGLEFCGLAWPLPFGAINTYSDKYLHTWLPVYVGPESEMHKGESSYADLEGWWFKRELSDASLDG